MNTLTVTYYKIQGIKPGVIYLKSSEKFVLFLPITNKYTIIYKKTPHSNISWLSYSFQYLEKVFPKFSLEVSDEGRLGSSQCLQWMVQLQEEHLWKASLRCQFSGSNADAMMQCMQKLRERGQVICILQISPGN